MSTSDEILAELLRYGKPLLAFHGDLGWHATLECNVATVGASFDMKSEFRHETPLAALTQLRTRTEAAMVQLQAQAKPASQTMGFIAPDTPERRAANSTAVIGRTL